MSEKHRDLRLKIMQELEKNPGQSVMELAKRLKINRTFLAGYLEALENRGYVRSKKIGPARVYFKEAQRSNC
ncbi:MAG: winged helix-turn-helix domain-containing protein [Nitrososphaerota archaeon]